MKHTIGIWKQSHRIIDEDENYATQVYTDDTIICTLDWAGHKEDDGKTTTSRREANARLIAEAGTVANETGKTPRQLADENKELLEALQEIKKGEGAYNMDKYEHANNTIENMKSLATQAINKATT